MASYTVITILGYDYMGKCYVLYSERLNGIDILDQVRRVEQLALLYNVQMVGSDRGCGQLQFELLRSSPQGGQGNTDSVLCGQAKVALRPGRATLRRIDPR